MLAPRLAQRRVFGASGAIRHLRSKTGLGGDLGDSLGVVGVALAARLVALSAWGVQAPHGDYSELMRLACSLASSDGYVSMFGFPTAYFPPGHALLVAPVMAITDCDALWAVAAVQIALSTITAAIWHRIALNMELPRRWALGVGLAVSAIPHSSVLALAMIDTSWLSCLFAASLWLGSRLGGGNGGAWRVAAVGAMVGVGLLIKPVILAVPAAILIWRRGATGAMGVVVLIALLFPTLWAARNYVAFEDATFIAGSNNAGIVNWIGRTRHAEERNSVLVYEADSRWLKEGVEVYPDDPNALYTLPDGDIRWRSWMAPTQAYEVAQNRRAHTAALETVRERPEEALRAAWWNFSMMVMAASDAWRVHAGDETPPAIAVATAFAPFSAFLVVLGMAGILWSWRDSAYRTGFTAMALSFGFYTFVAHYSDVYALPFMPLGYILGTMAIRNVFELPAVRHHRSIVIVANHV